MTQGEPDSVGELKSAGKTYLQALDGSVTPKYRIGSDRLDLWHKLEIINLYCAGPWALAGDFNTVLSPDERLGGNTKQDDMDDFIRCMRRSGMTDIPFTGALFPWNNKVREAWGKQYDGYKMFSVVKRLKGLKHVLKKLNMECYSDIENKTINAERRLEQLQKDIVQDISIPVVIDQEQNAIAELKVLTKARNSFLQQKAKLQWLEEGDQNTAYFHGAI
ncbi:uncharacterized protein LOC141601397 [Silene latifolia]|uniref:uncharacterized protein LOC141601397 n=1 Tax=Silene latifolia TaxID=37657 RepID=UPI003D789F54